MSETTQDLLRRGLELVEYEASCHKAREHWEGGRALDAVAAVVRRELEAPATGDDVRERVDVPGLPDGITPLTGVFTTHHAGRPHAIVLWQGAPWLVWQHPDGNWVTEAKVQVAALLRTPRGEGEAWRAFLDALDEYEAAANLWADPEGPTAADMERLRQSRRRVIECALALASIRCTEDDARQGEAPGEGPVGAVCANCGDPNAAIAGGELDPDEAVCSVECYEQLRELGCPQEHGGTYRLKPARRGEGGSNGLE